MEIFTNLPLSNCKDNQKFWFDKDFVDFFSRLSVKKLNFNSFIQQITI